MKAKLKVNIAQKVPIQFYFQQQGKKQESDKDSETACEWEREGSNYVERNVFIIVFQ